MHCRALTRQPRASRADPSQLDSAYLSSPNAEHTPLTAVLEQLFEDLNSYSETSIPLDGFNSLELKLFPFYRTSARGGSLSIPLLCSTTNGEC